MKKKIAILFLIVFLGGLFFPLVSLAAHTYTACQSIDDQGNCVGEVEVCYQGLVPCGLGKPYWVGGTADADCLDGSKNEGGVVCQFCHFFVMLDGIVDFTIRYIVIPVAVLMLVIGGVMFFFAGAKPEMMTKGKSLITSVIIGLVIIFASYLIIGVVLAAMGLADTNPIKDWFTGDSFTINCPIELQAAGNRDGNGNGNENGENGENGEEEEEEEEEACDDQCGWPCGPGECHGFTAPGGGHCHFDEGTLDHCWECTGGDNPISSCPDYFSQQSCEADICGTGESCLWDEDEGSCTSMSILCEDWQRMADYFNVPSSARRSGDLENFLTCLESKTMQSLPSEGAGNDFYGSVFTWDHDHEACNYNRGDTTCSACSHTHYSCHYGGGTGTEGALAVDFGNELNIIPIRDAANQCCQDIWDEYCMILHEGNHIHISIPPCDRN